MTTKDESTCYLTRLNGVLLEEKDRRSMLALAESVDDLVSQGAAERLNLDGVPWSFDTLRAEYDPAAQVQKPR